MKQGRQGVYRMSLPYLSYLMGADQISDPDLTDLGIEIVEKAMSGHRALKIPKASIERYQQLVRNKMTPGFWNEFLDENGIHFIFKFKNGDIKELTLSEDTEHDIDQICAELNGETPADTANVYKWISNNHFYHDFMLKHYRVLIDR